MPVPVRLLCAGDIHLGRCPSCISADRRELTVAHVWERFVQEAIDREVEAVVLTGDTVDEENKVFEAMRALEQGVCSLIDAGIEVIAVAGNHDHDAFPRLLRNLGDAPLQFLGAKGQWETHILHCDGKPRVQFAGWSFPRRHVPTSPLEDFTFEENGLPTIGVLHCDVNQMDSRYAPVERRALGRAPVEGWLLGHIHRSEKHYDGQQLHLYPGSLQPLHPNEPGRHGAWLVEVEPEGSVSAEPVYLASLCYDKLRIDVSDCEAIDEVEQRTSDRVRIHLQETVEAMPRLRHAVCRLVFEGRTALARSIDDWASEFVDGFETSFEDATVGLDAYSLEVTSRHDLEHLAKSTDPPGMVARLLLDIKKGENSELVQEARKRAKKVLRSVHTAAGYELLRRDAASADLPSDEDVDRIMMRRGLLLLDELMNQHDESSHA